mgnify:CR=1 FL=1
MKSVNRICLMMILCCVCCINIAQAAVNPKPFVIPELKEWKGNEGKFIPTEQTRIVYPKGNSELQRIARMLADDCNTLFNHTPQIVEGKGKKGDLILSLKKRQIIRTRRIRHSRYRPNRADRPQSHRCILGNTYPAADSRTKQRRPGSSQR